MFCPKCGKKLDDSAIFCQFCGAKVKDFMNEEPVNEAPVNEKKEIEPIKENTPAPDIVIPADEDEPIKVTRMVVPKNIKETTDADREEDAKEVKEMFFKKAEPSQELLNELAEAEMEAAKATEKTMAVEAANKAKIDKEKEEIENIKEEAKKANFEGANKSGLFKKAIGDMSDEDLDKPVFRTKIFIIGVIVLIALGVASGVVIVTLRTRTSMSYSSNTLENNPYDKFEISETPKVKNGWEGDYFYRNDKAVKEEWVKYNNDWYYCGRDGATVKNEWVDLKNGSWSYCDDTGKMALNDYKLIDGALYFFDSNGVMVHDTLTPNGSYATSDGTIR